MKKTAMKGKNLILLCQTNAIFLNIPYGSDSYPQKTSFLCPHKTKNHDRLRLCPINLKILYLF